MYGIIGTSVVLGMGIIYLIKHFHIKSTDGQEIVINPKAKTYRRYIIGGFIFGLGWALAGICPAPMFILLGSGYTVLILFLASAMLGTYMYGVLRKRLPH